MRKIKDLLTSSVNQSDSVDEILDKVNRLLQSHNLEIVIIEDEIDWPLRFKIENINTCYDQRG